jgi:hypothetical protein
MFRQAYDGALGFNYDSTSSRVALRNNPRCGIASMPLRACK